MTDLNEIPTDELRADLHESQTDILVCEFALALNVTEYSGGRSVRERLEDNRAIAKAIEEELARRGTHSVTVL